MRARSGSVATPAAHYRPAVNAEAVGAFAWRHGGTLNAALDGVHYHSSRHLALELVKEDMDPNRLSDWHLDSGDWESEICWWADWAA